MGGMIEKREAREFNGRVTGWDEVETLDHMAIEQRELGYGSSS